MQTVILVAPILLVPVLSNNLLSNDRGSVGGGVNRNRVVTQISQTMYLQKMVFPIETTQICKNVSTRDTSSGNSLMTTCCTWNGLVSDSGSWSARFFLLFLP